MGATDGPQKSVPHSGMVWSALPIGSGLYASMLWEEVPVCRGPILDVLVSVDRLGQRWYRLVALT